MTFAGRRTSTLQGARLRILSLLEPLVPKSVDLASKKTALLEGGLDSPQLTPEFKQKFLDVVAFLCCLSRQAPEVKWRGPQLQRWEELGLDVAEELAKKNFETPVPVLPVEEAPPKPQPEEAPPKEAPTEEAPPKEAPAAPEPEAPKEVPPPPEPEAPRELPKEVVPSVVSMGLVDARLTLPSGEVTTLSFDPNKSFVVLNMQKPLNECTMEEVQNELLKKERVINGMVLRQAKTSDIIGAENIKEVDVTEFRIEGDFSALVLLAKQDRQARIHVSGKHRLAPSAHPEAKMSEGKAIPPLVPAPLGKKKEKEPEEEKPQTEEKPETAPEPPAPAKREEPKEAPPAEPEAPQPKPRTRRPPPPAPRAPGPRPIPEKCERFSLSLDKSPKDLRQETLRRLIELLNAATAEADTVQISATCLAWSANAEIYERLYMTSKRNWNAVEPVEGAPTASHWLGVKLQTALDTKDIGEDKATIKAVTRNTRLCIDAVRVLGALMSQKRADQPDAPVAGPASVLATAMNITLDAGDMLPTQLTNFSLARCSSETAAVKANLWPLSLTIFMSAISWYHVGVECLVLIHQEHRHLLSYLAMPDEIVIDSFLSFVHQYNGILQTLKRKSSKPKSTLEKAAKHCETITLSAEKTSLPEAVGEVELKLGEQWAAIAELIKAS
ncbi:hypothetical protein Efla_001524 [Eimeria flavescens]